MQELELRQYWVIIRKRLIIVLVIPIIAVVVSAILSFFVMKPQYEADTTLLVNQKPTSDQLQYNLIQANQALVATYSNIIKSTTVEQSVIQQLGLPYTTKQLDRMIKVSSQNQSQVIDISVTAPNVQQAANIANTLASAFSNRAQTLMQVQNVQVVDSAVASNNSTPVKPNKKLNIAIACILGLLVSVGLAFLLEYLDNRLRTEDDVRRYLQLPVLGAIMEYDFDS